MVVLSPYLFFNELDEETNNHIAASVDAIFWFKFLDQAPADISACHLALLLHITIFFLKEHIYYKD